MASCGHPNVRDHDQPVETDGTNEDVEVPSSGNKGKRIEKEGDSGSMPIKKLRSWVWDHFTRQENNIDRANCHYCGKEMTCPTKSGTSNLKKHLNNTCKSYKLWEAANKFKNQTVIGTDGDGGALKLCKVSEVVVREATAELIVTAELPLAFIESLPWRTFCSKVQLYKPVSRRTLTRDIVEIYAKRKEAMKRIIGRNKQRVSLTTDIWVCPHTRASYMVITAHFIDDLWQLRKLIISFKNVYDHKGATISKVLAECLAEWDIKRVFTVTVDNATANSSALRRFKGEFKNLGDDALVLNGEFMHLRCATHILNLVVKDGLEEIDSSINAIRNGILFVRSSTPRMKSFEDRVELGRVQRGSVPLDVRTRWNSTYLMLEQAIKFRIGFEKMLAEDIPYNEYFKDIVDGKKRTGPPTKEDWDSISRLVQFLIIFYKSTLILSASTSICSHKLYSEIVCIIRNIKALNTSDGSDQILKSKAVCMLGKLEKYWDPFGTEVEMNKLVIVATVFDPTKKMKFAQLCFEKLYGKDSAEASNLYDSIVDILRRLFDEYSSRMNKNRSDGPGTSSQSHGVSFESQEQIGDSFTEKTILGNGLEYESMNDIYRELVQEIGSDENLSELELYLKESVENPTILQGSEFTVLSWWRLNSPKFPVLSLIARDIFAMQVSSVASESAFSTSGRVLAPSRSCLTHYTLEVLMCTQQWLKCETKVNERGVIRKEQMLADIEFQDGLMREYEPEFNIQGRGYGDFN